MLAGYFTPASYDRKGPYRFLKDRALRLGVPLLLFGLLVAPVTVALVEKSNGHSYLATILQLISTHSFIDGPMWFAEALLIFSLGYSVWRALTRNFGLAPSPAPVPGPQRWLLNCLAVGLGTLVLRQFFPIDRRVLGLWLGNFVPYVFFFCVGVKAWHSDWLSRFTWRQARLSIFLTALSIPTFPVALRIFYARGGTAASVRGFTWINIYYAFWEPLVAFGLIAAFLLASRRLFNFSTPVWSWIDRRAYGVYFIHPLVLVAISLSFHRWHAPVPIKFAVVCVSGCIMTWFVSDLLRRVQVYFLSLNEVSYLSAVLSSHSHKVRRSTFSAIKLMHHRIRSKLAEVYIWLSARHNSIR